MNTMLMAEFVPVVFDLSGVDFTIIITQLMAVLPVALPISLMIRGFYGGLGMIRKATRGRL